LIYNDKLPLSFSYSLTLWLTGTGGGSLLLAKY